MSIELSLLKAFCEDREVEIAHYGYLDSLDNMERELKLLFALVHSYYKDYDKKSISKDELLAYYDIKYPKARDREMHIQLVNQSFAVDISNEMLKAQLDQLIEKHHATKIINKLLPVMEGDKYNVLDTIRADIDGYVDLLHNPPDHLTVPAPCELSIEELIETEINDIGLPWHMPTLTETIGGLRKKTLGLIYAFVDSGKTSYAMASVANFARQLAATEDYICYCGNEEAAGRLRLRLVQALLNWTRKQVQHNPKEATRLALENGIDRIKVFDNITTSVQLEYILREWRPYAVYIDQAPTLEIPVKRNKEGVDYLEALFKYLRRIANNYNTGVVGVAQGVGEAEDTKWLRLSDIYGSRVAIQHALDWAVGIGRKINNPVDESLRYLNIPKNKLNDGDSAKITAMFNRYLCEWTEV